MVKGGKRKGGGTSGVGGRASISGVSGETNLVVHDNVDTSSVRPQCKNKGKLLQAK